MIRGAWLDVPGTVAPDLDDPFASECWNCQRFGTFVTGSVVAGPERATSLTVGRGLTAIGTFAGIRVRRSS